MTKTFRDLGVDPSLCDALADGGITHPFPIQELTLPLALDGHDLIGQARTGTGKTLAFGLPLLQRLDATTKQTQALVIVPTRELCLQVYSDLQIGAARGLTSISVYGGVGYDEQIDALGAGAQVVVGTPGRLLDLLNRGVLDLSKVTQLVLDEADEMLDMGFLPDVERLVEACQGEDRHTMLFSATMPTAIVKLARRYMDHPTFTRADHEQKNTAPLVTQYFFEVHRMDKPRLLARILQSKDRGGVYVFVRTKHMADRLVNDLEELRIPSIAIHGDLRQSTREKNLDRFRAGQATVLVCTEVAARGLDVTGVTHVVNYDCPDDEKMYLHRIGRTARAGESGVAITFAEFNEVDRLNVIRKAVGAVDSEVQQVFSTSKDLTAMFDLPEDRPWDHLTTKAGSDQARAKRESRSDGRPKSGRAQEGRGGDHDARRSARSDDRGQGRGRSQRRGQDVDKAQGKDEAHAKAQGTDKEQQSRTRTEGEDQGKGRSQRQRRDSRRRAEPSDAERSPSSDDTSHTAPAPDAGRSKADDEQPRDRDRGAEAVTPTTRTRTRTRARAAGSSTSTSERRPRDDASTSGSRDAKRDASGEPAEQQSGSDGEPGSSGSGGRQRARGGQRAGGKQRSRGSQDSGGRPGRDERQDERQDERAGGRSSRDTDRSEGGPRAPGSRGGRPRGGSRGTERSGRAGRGPESDPTVQVATRGEDARGEGQPQVARRVKVEHLP